MTLRRDHLGAADGAHPAVAKITIGASVDSSARLR